MVIVFFFFFFKQKTAYEMRISDWSSDVCSSDLEDFPPRDEQVRAVEQTYAYYHSRWQEDAAAVPRFLWNAKMRFGKTFTSYQLAKKLDAKRVLEIGRASCRERVCQYV